MTRPAAVAIAFSHSLPSVSMSPTCITSYRDLQPLEALKAENTEGHESPQTGKIAIFSDIYRIVFKQQQTAMNTIDNY